MNRRKSPLLRSCAAAALLLLAVFNSAAPAPSRAESEARGDWLSVRSQNFLVVGQSDEKGLRRAALRLEEYRAAFSRLLSDEHFDLTVPTTVILFRDDETYAPYKPILGGRLASGVAGYFQPGAEVNYITLALDEEGDRESSTLLHEYAHLLVNNYFRLAPLWVKEGLAEYYSTARLSGDRKRVTLGGQPKRRARHLSGRPLLPLRTLFAVDQQSPHYFDAEKRGTFYAQSWALVHYLMGGERRAQFTRLLELLAAGATIDDALREALQTDAELLEAELSGYVSRAIYVQRTETLDRAVEFGAQLQTRQLTRAESLYHLGDLLLRTDRPEAAEEHLRRALEADAEFSPARVSLGALRVKQGRFDEARELLEKATQADPLNHLAHYHLGDALYREGAGADLSGLTAKAFDERTALIRSEFRRAIELAPAFLEPYKLLAAVELDRGGSPDEAATLLTRALALAPRRLDLKLLLAQVRLSKGEFEEARRLTAEVERRGGDPLLREQARKVFGYITAREEQAAVARLKAHAEEQAAQLEASAAPGPLQPCDMPAHGPQRKALRFDGAQACGHLLRIECDDDAVVLHFEGGEGKLRLRAAALSRIRFVTYTSDVKTGALTCGARQPADLVLVTYRPRRDDKSASDGEAVAVEFIPPEWNN